MHKATDANAIVACSVVCVGMVVRLHTVFFLPFACCAEHGTGVLHVTSGYL